ncbi:Mediator of RNA polymerase II transcription subunit 21 [Hibiscus syriacus]|uniref:Mediator of RNA polymerase II transcription subunit 21 n=1 Tax=Hibiscus syriacus TaxID=106335 RepID=A0A6A3CJE9_HIBSY|nr:Mediator of RNA polymerase II transcription subunit 21 [Hibiscus syriacus]
MCISVDIYVEAAKASESMSTNIATSFLPTEHQALSSDLNPHESVQDDVKSLVIDNNGAPEMLNPFGFLLKKMHIIFQLQDAPLIRLLPNYPEPPTNPTQDSANEPKLMSAALVKAAKQFDALVASLPPSDGGEEAQLTRIAELYNITAGAENDAVGEELQKQLEAVEKELKQVHKLFSQAADNCLNLKKTD